MSSDITTRIQAICAKGYQDYTQRHYDAALRLFYQAWLQLPKPQADQSLAATVLSAIGDTYYRLGKYDLAIEALRSALACQETPERSLILLRLGQSLLNSGHDLQAKTYLYRAYRMRGNDAFEGEHDRYKEAIADLMI
jgi:tetratricopeptide (TPR) repeat protein